MVNTLRKIGLMGRTDDLFTLQGSGQEKTIPFQVHKVILQRKITSGFLSLHFLAFQHLTLVILICKMGTVIAPLPVSNVH